MEHSNPAKSQTHSDILDGLASLSYLERLTKFIRGSTKHWVIGGVTVIDLRPLYAVTVHNLQRHLAKEIHKVDSDNTTEQQLEKIEDLLKRYSGHGSTEIHKHIHRLTSIEIANALRDFEFIHSNRWNTEFVKDIAASRFDNGQGSRLHAALISDLNLKANPTHRSLFRESDLLGAFDPNLMQHSTAIGQSLGTDRAEMVAREEHRRNFTLASKRFAFAIIGELMIVVPVLILVAGIASVKSLVVISVSIFLFALGVASFSKTEPENLLAATAAYAAVLTALITWR